MKGVLPIYILTLLLFSCKVRKKDQYVNTVDEVERITGYDFFPSLPDSIEEKVESYANLDDWR